MKKRKLLTASSRRRSIRTTLQMKIMKYEIFRQIFSQEESGYMLIVRPGRADLDFLEALPQ